MMSSTQEMTDAQALAAVLAKDAAAQAGDHPELDELADYLAGGLAPEIEAQIQNHLVGCRACTTQLLDLETLAEPGPQTTEGVADLAVAAGWREQKNRIADVESARRRQRSMRWISAVAASFFVATVGLSVHTTQLRQTIAGLEAPEINVPIAYFDSAATRNNAEPVTHVFGPGDRSLLLTLTPIGSEAWSDYEVEVLNATGSKVWSGRGFVLSEIYGTVRLRMSRALLPDGDYEVRLHGLDGDRREPLQAISLQIRSE